MENKTLEARLKWSKFSICAAVLIDARQRLPARRLDEIVKDPFADAKYGAICLQASGVKAAGGLVPSAVAVRSVSVDSPLPAPFASIAAERWPPPWPRS